MSQAIAENLRRVMADRDIDSNELASRLGYANRATIDHWLSGRRLPTPDNLKRVSEVLEVPVDTLDPSGNAFKLTGRRRKSRGVDKTAELGKIPYSPQQPPTTTTEGPMSDQVRRLEGALLLLPEQHRESFVRKISLIAAQTLIELEGPGVMPGKRARVSGKG